MISDEAIFELEKQGKKNKLLMECYDTLMRYLDSPAAESLLASIEFIKNMDEQVGKYDIDISADKEEKGFERVLAYQKALPELYKGHAVLRSLIDPEKEESKNSKKKMEKMDTQVAI